MTRYFYRLAQSDDPESALDEAERIGATRVVLHDTPSCAVVGVAEVVRDERKDVDE